MTDPRATEMTTDEQRTEATPPPARDPGPGTPPRPGDGPTDARPSQPLSTADIAGGRTDVADRPAETNGRSHQSQMPDMPVAPLFSEQASTEMRDRWTDIQAGFVDEPRSAVEKADQLVAEVMKRLADSFANERQTLEQQWSSGRDASTEDLRVALRRYRSFFDRLLSI